MYKICSLLMIVWNRLSSDTCKYELFGKLTLDKVHFWDCYLEYSLEESGIRPIFSKSKCTFKMD